MASSSQAPSPHPESAADARRQLFLDVLANRLPVALHFQPIIDVHAGSVAGYEALCRFPEAFGAPPDLCFAQARSFGLGLALEDFVLRRAVAARSLLPRNCFLSVNVGPAFLLSQEFRTLLAAETDLAGLVFEVTEEATVADYSVARDCLSDIRHKGGMIAVDDAGSGYAGLAHILEMKPEFIKVDRRIIQNCHRDRAKSTVIEMLGAAANRMNAWILGEGVECAGELEELQLLGVPLVQGFFLGRPAPEMTGIAEEARTTLLGTRHQRAEEGSLHGLFSPALGYPSLESAVLRLRQLPAHSVAVVVDAWGRPTQVLHSPDQEELQSFQLFLKAQLASDAREVLQRAMLRPLPSRFEPIVVIDPEGHLLGVLSVDRLLSFFLGSPFPKNGKSTAGSFTTAH